MMQTTNNSHITIHNSKEYLGPFELGKVHHADCVEAMKLLPDKSVDCVITDPPYMNLKGGLEVSLDSGVAKRNITNKTVGDLWGANLNWIYDAWRICKFGLLCFCSYHFIAEVPIKINQNPVALITWFQRNAMPSICNAPHYQTEFIWVFKKESRLIWKNLKTHYDIPRLQTGCMATERICENGQAVHPTQKPISLIKELLKIGGDIILDPFSGSGTTGVACAQLGRRFLGFEIDKEYCNLANDRIAAAHRGQTLQQYRSGQTTIFDAMERNDNA
jgi:DNA modification methylase